MWKNKLSEAAADIQSDWRVYDGKPLSHVIDRLFEARFRDVGDLCLNEWRLDTVVTPPTADNFKYALASHFWSSFTAQPPEPCSKNIWEQQRQIKLSEHDPLDTLRFTINVAAGSQENSGSDGEVINHKTIIDSLRRLRAVALDGVVTDVLRALRSGQITLCGTRTPVAGDISPVVPIDHAIVESGEWRFERHKNTFVSMDADFMHPPKYRDVRVTAVIQTLSQTVPTAATLSKNLSADGPVSHDHIPSPTIEPRTRLIGDSEAKEWATRVWGPDFSTLPTDRGVILIEGRREFGKKGFNQARARFIRKEFGGDSVNGGSPTHKDKVGDALPG